MVIGCLALGETIRMVLKRISMRHPEGTKSKGGTN